MTSFRDRSWLGSLSIPSKHSGGSQVHSPTTALLRSLITGGEAGNGNSSILSPVHEQERDMCPEAISAVLGLSGSILSSWKRLPETGQ